MPADKDKVKEFYGTPWVRRAIFDLSDQRNVCLRFDWGMLRHYSKQRGELAKLAMFGSKPLLEDFIQFQFNNENEKNPADIQYWINQGVTEFIPEVTTVYDLDRSTFIVIDLDPKDPTVYDFEATRQATARVLDTLMGVAWDGTPLKLRGIPAKGFRLRFSGNRSFHIYIDLLEPTDLKKLREQVKELLDVGIEPTLDDPNEKLHMTYHNVRDRKDYILVDIGAIARHRCVRSLWSVHAKTGWVCCPVENLFTFQRERAQMEEVLARGPQDERSCLGRHPV